MPNATKWMSASWLATPKTSVNEFFPNWNFLKKGVYVPSKKVYTLVNIYSWYSRDPPRTRFLCYLHHFYKLVGISIILQYENENFFERYLHNACSFDLIKCILYSGGIIFWLLTELCEIMRHISKRKRWWETKRLMIKIEKSYSYKMTYRSSEGIHSNTSYNFLNFMDFSNFYIFDFFIVLQN